MVKTNAGSFIYVESDMKLEQSTDKAALGL